MKSSLAALSLAVSTVANAACVPSPKALVKKFSTFVVFGDSYTDDGVRAYTPPVPDVSYNNSERGLVWPLYVRQYANLDNLYNYAKSGAVCDAVESHTLQSGIKNNQIPTFEADKEWRNETSGEPAIVIPPEETVYAIWIGTNDIGKGGFLTEVQPPGMPLTYYTDCVYSQLDSLYALGARAFVLMNLAPLDLTPQYGLPENGGLANSMYWRDKSEYESNITRSSEEMRQYLTMSNAVFDYQTPYEVQLADRYPDSKLAVYDINGLLTDIWHHPAEYLNGTVPYNVTGSSYRCGEACKDLDTRDSYLWQDDLHPSEQTGRIIAREFVNIVKGKGKWVKYWSS